MLTALGIIAVLIGMCLGMLLGRLVLAFAVGAAFITPYAVVVWAINEGKIPPEWGTGWQSIMIIAGVLGCVVGFVAYPLYLLDRTAFHIDSSELHKRS
jgi:hypothetical protein